MKPFLIAGMASALAACAAPTPLYTGQAVGTATVFLDFVADNLPRNLSGQILPLEMILFEIDPQTGARTNAPSWSVGVCQAQAMARALGCETGEIKTLKLELPPGTYAVGYLGSTSFAAPWYFLMDFDSPERIGGGVKVAGLTVTPQFSRNARIAPRTPLITVQPGGAAYAGVLRAAYGDHDLTTRFTPAPERKAVLVAQSGAALADRPGYYR